MREPLPHWVTDAMQGDFGESYRYEGTSVGTGCWAVRCMTMT